MTNTIFRAIAALQLLALFCYSARAAGTFAGLGAPQITAMSNDGNYVVTNALTLNVLGNYSLLNRQSSQTQQIPFDTTDTIYSEQGPIDGLVILGVNGVSNTGVVAVDYEGSDEFADTPGYFPRAWTYSNGNLTPLAVATVQITQPDFPYEVRNYRSDTEIAAISPDGKYAGGSGIGFRTAYNPPSAGLLWSVNNAGQLPQTLSGEPIAFSADDKYMLAGGARIQLSTMAATTIPQAASYPYEKSLGLSGNGNTVVGTAYNTINQQLFSNQPSAAVRWNDTDGNNVLPLDPTVTSSWARSSSSDGSRIVGGGYNAAGKTALLWDHKQTGRTVQDVLSQGYGLGNQLTGWTLTDARFVSGDGRVIAGDGVNPQGASEAWLAEVPRKFVVLHFGTPAPGDFRIIKDSKQNQFTVFDPSLPARAAATVTSKNQQLLVDQVQAIYDGSGVQSVAVTTDSVPNAVNVYFSVGLPASPNGRILLGKSVSLYSNGGLLTPGINRFDATPTGDVVVLDSAFLGGVSEAALTVAHEVGHALGLMHVDSNSTEVMKPNYATSTNEQFVNAVTPIVQVDPATTIESSLKVTQNPLYHLRHYVDGVPDDILRAQGVLPGDFDKPIPISVGSESFANFASDQELFNVQLLLGNGSSDGGDAFEVIKSKAEMSTSDIKSLLQGLPIGFSLRLVASSVNGGPLDVVLSDADPLNPENLSIPITGEATSFWLSRFDGSASGFTLLGIGTLSEVPEPGALSLAAIAFFELLSFSHIRRRKYLTNIIY